MIKLAGNIRGVKGVALSGGADSMALLSFLQHGKHQPDAYFFDHGTDASRQAHEFLLNYCSEHHISLRTQQLNTTKPKQDSWEEFWRKERYAWLHAQGVVIATAHHLNDVAETYIWGCAHAKPRYIHYLQPGSRNIVRPLLLTTKQQLLEWCSRKHVPFLEDQSNNDLRFVRNRIRHNVIPELEQVNPGLLTSMKRMMERRLHNYYCYGGIIPCPEGHSCAAFYIARDEDAQ